MGKLINSDDIPWDVDGIGFIPVIGKDEIDEMPEAVVRCKDCKWWKVGYMWDGKEVRVCAVEPYEPCREADDFCSAGESREDNG